MDFFSLTYEWFQHYLFLRYCITVGLGKVDSALDWPDLGALDLDLWPQTWTYTTRIWWTCAQHWGLYGQDLFFKIVQLYKRIHISFHYISIQIIIDFMQVIFYKLSVNFILNCERKQIGNTEIINWAKENCLAENSGMWPWDNIRSQCPGV